MTIFECIWWQNVCLCFCRLWFLSAMHKFECRYTHSDMSAQAQREGGSWAGQTFFCFFVFFHMWPINTPLGLWVKVAADSDSGCDTCFIYAAHMSQRHTPACLCSWRQSFKRINPWRQPQTFQTDGVLADLTLTYPSILFLISTVMSQSEMMAASPWFPPSL